MLRRPFRSTPVVSLFALLTLALVLSACPAGSPEERVAKLRAKYTVTLNTWFAKAVEPPVMIEDATGEPAEDAGADGTVSMVSGEVAAVVSEVAEEGAEEGAEGLIEEVGPTTSTIVFDLIVGFNGREKPLPGLTVDFSHADSAGKDKATWREYLELPGMVKGESRQFTLEKEDIVLEEGDQFSATLTGVVTAAERSEYREFSEVE